MSEKFNYNEFTPTANRASYSTNQYANTFTPTVSYDIDYIILKGSRFGNCVSVDLDIYLANGVHKPTGGSLANVQILQANLPTDTFSEITFTLGAALSITASQEYVIVISSAGPDISNSFLWGSKTLTQTDWFMQSSDSGGTWITTQLISFWYQVWGTGPSKASAPSPADEAADQQTGGVTLSWTDDNPGDDYEVYFGLTGSMVLVQSEYGSTSLTISDTLTFEQEYSWRIDINIGAGIVIGDVWTFTIESFDPPTVTNLRNKRYLIAISNNEVWYEDL